MLLWTVNVNKTLDDCFPCRYILYAVNAYVQHIIHGNLIELVG